MRKTKDSFGAPGPHQHGATRATGRATIQRPDPRHLRPPRKRAKEGRSERYSAPLRRIRSRIRPRLQHRHDLMKDGNPSCLWIPPFLFDETDGAGEFPNCRDESFAALNRASYRIVKTEPSLAASGAPSSGSDSRR